jgi:hypothetical protein
MNEMKNITKSCFIVLLTILVIAIFLSQLQPFIIRAAGGVDGTFGVRPVSHKCLGITHQVTEGDFWPPNGDLEFTLWLFQFRYLVSEKDRSDHSLMCTGQDLWFGE